MKDTITRLRNRLWFILVSVFYTLIVTGLVIIYLITSQNTQDIIYQTLYTRVLSQQLYAQNSFFSIELAVDGNIVDIHSDFNLPDDKYEELVRLVLINARDYNTLILYEQIWVYAIIPEPHLLYPTDEYEYQFRIIFIDVTEIMEAQNFVFITLIIFGIVSLILTVLGGYFLTNSILKSTKKSYDRQLEITSKQRRFTANATHELRTPLAMIKGGYEEIMSNTQDTIEQQLKWFQMIGFGIKRMESLTSELLTLAKLENDHEPLTKEVINVGETVNFIVDSMQILASEKNIVIKKDIIDDVAIHLNEEKFNQVLMIFLDNAIKYVNDAGNISASVTNLDGQIKIIFENSGPGIPAADLPKVFERFYRLDSTPKDKRGTGLGLPIAKEIVEQLGGNLYIDSVVNEFTKIEIVFSFND